MEEERLSYSDCYSSLFALMPIFLACFGGIIFFYFGFISTSLVFDIILCILFFIYIAVIKYYSTKIGNL